MPTKTKKIESRGNYERKRVQQSFKGVESMTQQSDVPMTSISIRNLLKAGVVPDDTEAVFGDFSNVEDYQTMLDRINEAQRKFDALPARIRHYFGNDPAELIAFLDDPENRDEAIKLGLVHGDNSDAVPDDVSPVGGSPEGDSSSNASDDSNKTSQTNPDTTTKKQAKTKPAEE